MWKQPATIFRSKRSQNTLCTNFVYRKFKVWRLKIQNTQNTVANCNFTALIQKRLKAASICQLCGFELETQHVEATRYYTASLDYIVRSKRSQNTLCTNFLYRKFKVWMLKIQKTQDTVTNCNFAALIQKAKSGSNLSTLNHWFRNSVCSSNPPLYSITGLYSSV